jgi:hypothetical protein
VDEMRATVCSTLMALIITTAGAQAQGCTPNHELYRIVPEDRAIMLDGGDIKRVMFVDWKDERLTLWKPGHNITFCPDENKMINTTINSVATLTSEFANTCKTLMISDAIDRSLQRAWDYTNRPNGDPSVFVTEAESNLGWYYEVCTDHADVWFEKNDFKDFLYSAALLTSVHMARRSRQREHLQGTGSPIREMAGRSVCGRGQEEFSSAHLGELNCAQLTARSPDAEYMP